MYYCLVNSLYTMVSKMSWCTTIKELLGGGEGVGYVGSEHMEAMSTRVGNLCIMFKIINNSHQPSVM